jgi:hypothetical protein
MADIKEYMEVIGADGVHVGTVDEVEGNRIRLTRKDSGEGSHEGHHHFVDRNLVADIEGNKVRLSAIGAVAVTMEQEKQAPQTVQSTRGKSKASSDPDLGGRKADIKD